MASLMKAFTIICFLAATGYIDAERLRLVDGRTCEQGRLEIRHGGAWNTICDDDWDDRDAAVACRELGLDGGTAQPGGVFPAGTGNIAMSNVSCTGLESELVNCPFLGWNQHNCTHSDDAGVKCRKNETPPPFFPIFLFFTVLVLLACCIGVGRHLKNNIGECVNIEVAVRSQEDHRGHRRTEVSGASHPDYTAIIPINTLPSSRPRAPNPQGSRRDTKQQESLEEKQSRLRQFIELEGRRSAINEQILHLKDTLDLKGDLVDKLIMKNVLSNTHKDTIMCKQNDRDKREQLIQIMRTADMVKYFNFLVVLSENQMDLVESLTENKWSLYSKPLAQ